MTNDLVQHLDPKADFGPIRDHFHQCFRESYSGVLHHRALDGLLDSLASEDIGGLVPGADETVAVVCREGRIVGSAIWAKRADRVYLWGFYVREACQRQRIGTALIEDLIRQQSAPVVIELSVLRASWQAIAFYRHIGFRSFRETSYEIAPQQELAAMVMTAMSSALVRS